MAKPADKLVDVRDLQKLRERFLLEEGKILPQDCKHLKSEEVVKILLTKL